MKTTKYKLVWERPPKSASIRQMIDSCVRTSQPEARQLATLLSLAYPHCDVYNIQRLNDNLALSSKYI